MKKTALFVALAAVLGFGIAAPKAEAGGCVAGALVGAGVGHMAHHGVLGAIGGCVGGVAVNKLWVNWQKNHPGATFKDFVGANRDKIQSLGVDPATLETAAGSVGGR
jgi:hypothetical protein